MKVPFLIILLCLFGRTSLQAKALLLDFGLTVTVAADATKSPAHFVGAVPGGEIAWNTITCDTNSLVYSDGTAATGVALDLGRSLAGSNTINFNDNGFTVSALGGQDTAGVYAGSSPVKDGIFGGAGGSNNLAVGLKLSGLAAGPYTIYLHGRNTSHTSGIAVPGRFYATTGADAATYSFTTNNANRALANSPTITTFVADDNYGVLAVNLAAGDFLYLADEGTLTNTEMRGFINTVEIVPGLPPTNSASPVVGSPTVSIQQNRLTLTYLRAKAATNYSFSVAASSNLFVWNSGSNFVDESIAKDDGTNVTCLAQDVTPVTSKPASFLRLKVNHKFQGSKVVFFGDSITLGNNLPAGSNWVDQLTTRFNLTAINAGVAGNTSSQGLARIQTDVLAPKPDFVLINFGMNDHVMNALDTPTVSKAAFQANLSTMIDRVRTNNSVPILVTVNYIIEGDATQYYYNRHPAAYYVNVGGAQAWLDSYIQTVRDLAAQKSVDLIEVRAACDNYNRFDFLRSLTNGANTDDGVHPYLLGASVYQQVIGDYLGAFY